MNVQIVGRQANRIGPCHLPRDFQVEQVCLFLQNQMSAGFRANERAAFAVFLLPTASQRFPPVLIGGCRSRLPLRGSPGFAPGSLLALKCIGGHQHGDNMGWSMRETKRRLEANYPRCAIPP